MADDRKMFKFYRSYYDVAIELPDKDRLAFYDAIMNRQFFGIEPNLKGLAKLVYISQKHSIDAQVKGWEDYFKLQLSNNHAMIPPMIPPIIQLKEKEKEEEKVKEYHPDVLYVLEKVKTYFDEKYINEDSKNVLSKLLKSYEKEKIIQAIVWAKNDSFWKTNFLSLSKLDKTNNDKVKYIDVFLAKSKSPAMFSDSYPDAPAGYTWRNGQLVEKAKPQNYR